MMFVSIGAIATLLEVSAILLRSYHLYPCMSFSVDGGLCSKIRTTTLSQFIDGVFAPTCFPKLSADGHQSRSWTSCLIAVCWGTQRVAADVTSFVGDG